MLSAEKVPSPQSRVPSGHESGVRRCEWWRTGALAFFLIAGVITFLLGFFLQGVMPILTLRKTPIKTVEQMAEHPPDSFYQLAEDYPDEFKASFGTPTSESLATAIQEGKATYIAEACWHCHSQFVRPVSLEDLRYGPVSTPEEFTAHIRAEVAKWARIVKDSGATVD